MKKLIAFLLILAVSTASFSQTTTPSPEKKDYFKKSKSQKTIAWILAGGGAGIAVISIASLNWGDIVNSIEGDNSSIITKEAFLLIGGVAVLSSIPLFIASGKNKRKGMSLSFKNETAPQIQKNSFVYRAIPSLTIKMSL
jgi:multisubunit Na+/H+ antiporter MnhB subunit